VLQNEFQQTVFLVRNKKNRCDCGPETIKLSIRFTIDTKNNYNCHAMLKNKRGWAVGWCLSVRSSVRLSRSIVILLKRINISSHFFHRRVVMAIFWWGPPSGGFARYFRPMSRFIACYHPATVMCHKQSGAGPWQVGDIHRWYNSSSVCW